MSRKKARIELLYKRYKLKEPKSKKNMTKSVRNVAMAL